MKKPTKSIITSSLLALAFGAMSVGSTFALFTSQSQTTINVGSGVVNVESSASLARYKSSVDNSDVDLTGLATYSNSLVGNEFSLEGSTVTIDKMVPGDSLTLKLSALNKSNVKTKTRYVVNHSVVGTKTDLYPALKFTFSAGNLSEADLFKWRVNEPVADITTGVAIYDDLSVTITFPDGDNGQILFGSANHDNQYQDAACSIAFSLQAVQANAATSPIDEINAYLEVEKMLGHENFTMHDAVLDMAAIGYTELSVLDGYVYDLANDQFVKESSVTANKVDYFDVYESMPDEQTFSIYAAGSNWTTVGGLIVGFDAGDTSGITSITYDRHEATVGQEVTIRTNRYETSLIVNAPLDTIHHYDKAGSVNIIAANTASYHENGDVPFLEVAGGHVVLEEESKVLKMHFTATGEGNNAQFKNENNQTISLDLSSLSEENMPDFSRDPVSIDENNGTYVAEVKTEATEYIWLWGNGTQTEMVTTQSEGEIADNGTLKDGIITGAEDGSIADQISNNAVVDEMTSETTYVPKTSKEEAQAEAAKVYASDIELTLNGVATKYLASDFEEDAVEGKYDAAFVMLNQVFYDASRDKTSSDEIKITLKSDVTAVYGSYMLRIAKSVTKQEVSWASGSNKNKYVAVDDIPTVTLDLNGHKLTLDTTAQCSVYIVNANLIVTDSTVGQTGEVTSHSQWTLNSVGNSNVILNGGTVGNTGDGGWFSVGIGIGGAGDSVVNSELTAYLPGENLYIKGKVTSPVNEEDIVEQMQEETAEGSTMTIDLENWCAIFTVDEE